MSLFRPYQYKNKPDLRPDAPVKNGFFVFWEIYFRKFWRFITLNLLWFLITLPILLAFYVAATNYFAGSSVMTALGEDYDLFAGITFYASLVSFVPQKLYLPILFLSIIIYGPLKMGQTYVFRNFAREEHAWLSDIISRAWSNLKQGLFFGILDAVVIYLLLNGVLGTILGTSSAMAVLSLILRIIATLALVFYLYMRKYFYIIAVTMNLSVFAIIKNAMLFVFIGFGRNLLAGIINVAVFVVCFLTVPLITFITLPLFYYSFTYFVSVFTCYPTIKKYLILPALEQANASGSNDTASDSERKDKDD